MLYFFLPFLNIAVTFASFHIASIFPSLIDFSEMIFSGLLIIVSVSFNNSGCILSGP